MAEHVGELMLRRLRLGELARAEAESATRHVEGCGDCRARLRDLDEEQRRFQQEISFERFSAGVTRAARRPPPSRIPARVAPVLAMAAALAIGVALVPLARHGESRIKGATKGTAEVALRIAGPAGAPQRDAALGAPEVLSRGERVRIGYKPGEHKYLVSVSVDEQGVVTPLYPEQGPALAVEPEPSMHYLPGSLEFYGRGAERVIVVLSERPLTVDEVKAAAKLAYDEAHGDVLRMPELRVPGEQFHQTLLKP